MSITYKTTCLICKVDVSDDQFFTVGKKSRYLNPLFTTAQ